MGWGLEGLQARFEEIQGLEKEGRAGPTDGATQESFDHGVQLQDKGTLSAAVPERARLCGSSQKRTPCPRHASEERQAYVGPSSAGMLRGVAQTAGRSSRGSVSVKL